jgi:hypothetical protein
LATNSAAFARHQDAGQNPASGGSMRNFFIIGVVAALSAIQASAEDLGDPCVGAPSANGIGYLPSARGHQMPLTENQCEAIIKREFRLSLFEIPQEDEDPMTVTLGLKNGGGILRLRIPFSF